MIQDKIDAENTYQKLLLLQKIITQKIVPISYYKYNKIWEYRINIPRFHKPQN